MVACLLAAASLAAPADAPAWKVERADVRVSCPLTVGGSFEAKTRALAGTLVLAAARPAAFSGELAVDLRTLDTGIALRDRHMRDEYLEVGKGAGFETAVLSEVRLADADADTVQGRTGFTARLALHGEKRTVQGRADIRRQGALARVDATFPVKLADFAIARPQYLGIGVKDEVEVKVSFAATPAAAVSGAAR